MSNDERFKINVNVRLASWSVIESAVEVTVAMDDIEQVERAWKR